MVHLKQSPQSSETLHNTWTTEGTRSQTIPASCSDTDYRRKELDHKQFLDKALTTAHKYTGQKKKKKKVLHHRQSLALLHKTTRWQVSLVSSTMENLLPWIIFASTLSGFAVRHCVHCQSQLLGLNQNGIVNICIFLSSQYDFLHLYSVQHYENSDTYFSACWVILVFS